MSPDEYVDLAFAGLSAAVPLLLGWTALAAVPRAKWPACVLVSTVVGIPFLIAAYYGERTSEMKYRLALPSNHPEGLFWFHPHVHMNARTQVGSGLSVAERSISAASLLLKFVTTPPVKDGNA